MKFVILNNLVQLNDLDLNFWAGGLVAGNSLQ